MPRISTGHTFSFKHVMWKLVHILKRFIRLIKKFSAPLERKFYIFHQLLKEFVVEYLKIEILLRVIFGNLNYFAKIYLCKEKNVTS